MANRSDRRKARKQMPRYERLSKEQKIALLYKNGITQNDLKREFDAGVDSGIQSTFRTIYAAVCLAAEELFGFKRERCKRLLRKIDETVIYSLSSSELIDEVFEKIGLELDFQEPFNRVKDLNE